MNTLLGFLIIAFFLLNILDVYSTLKVLKDDNYKEGNPILAFLMDKFGKTAGIVIPKLIIIGLLIWALNTDGITDNLLVPLVVINLIHLYAVVMNFKHLRKH